MAIKRSSVFLSCVIVYFLHDDYKVLGHSMTEASMEPIQQAFCSPFDNLHIGDVLELGNISVTSTVSYIVRNFVLKYHHFIPSSNAVKNHVCRQHSNAVLEEASRLQTWALRMLDSSAKISSGLLNGNVNEFGDFDQCIGISKELDSSYNMENRKIDGKYCLVKFYIKIKGGKNGMLQEMNSLLNSHFPVTSKFSDPGHRIPKQTEVKWAVCMPSSCSADDLRSLVVSSIARYNNSQLQIDTDVDPRLCYVENTPPISTGARLTSAFFVVLLAVSIGATVYESRGERAGKMSRLLTSFSLRKNIRSLTSTACPPDDINCVHGIRAMNALALLIFHKSVALMFNPYINRTAMVEMFGLAWSVIGRTSIIYTDSFILISGLLASYSLIKELDNQKKVNIKDKIFSRFLRFTPNLVAVILFSTYILVNLGSGPQWNLVVKHYSDICKQNMWKNILYIHNYYGFENMCLTHTHQLGLDMQLFLATPLLVCFLWRNPRRGMAVILLLGTLSTLLRLVVTFHKELSTVIYFGAPVHQLFLTANLSYTLPTHRATVYLMGIALGYILRRVASTPIAMNRVLVVCCWITALAMGLLAMCGPYHMALREYRYTPIDAALYNAFSPLLWGSFLCWGIFAAFTGYAGIVLGILCSIFSWKGFRIFTKISYAVYLTQFPVFFYNVGVTRNATYYSTSMMFDVGEVLSIMFLSVILTLLVDMPAQNVKRLLWDNDRE